MNSSKTSMNSSKIFKVVAASALASAIGSAYAGQITLYENPEFQGRYIATGDALPNLERTPMNRTASSIVVGDGNWEVCTEAYFRGRCAQLMPGSYSRLGAEFNGVIASVRLIGYDAGLSRTVIDSGAAPPIVINPGPAQVVINPGTGPVVINSDTRRPAVIAPSVIAAPSVVTVPTVVSVPVVTTVPAVVTTPAVVRGDTRIVLYEQDSSRGGARAVELTSNVDDLDRKHFENRANAAFVSGGVWRLCDHERGRGYCSDFSPGRYDSLGRQLNGKVSSAYIIAAAPDRVAAATSLPLGRMVLYQYPNYGGASAVVDQGRAPDLDWAKFKDRAASLRVESGTWLVCSNIGYEGECRIVGPGSYPQVAGLLSDGVYSARQVWRPEYGVVDPYYTRP